MAALVSKVLFNEDDMRKDRQSKLFSIYSDVSLMRLEKLPLEIDVTGLLSNCLHKTNNES